MCTGTELPVPLSVMTTITPQKVLLYSCDCKILSGHISYVNFRTYLLNFADMQSAQSPSDPRKQLSAGERKNEDIISTKESAFAGMSLRRN